MKFGDMEKMFYGTTTVGERGQVVIPAQARRELGIDAGDKLLVFQDPVASGALVLLKTEALRTMIGEWMDKWIALQKIVAEEGKQDE